MKKLGIIRETKNIWERRVALNPPAVKKLVEKGFEVIVQPSEIRIYKDEEYQKAGAIIDNDLSDCDFIIGVKEIKNEDMILGKPHLFFSHVIKGQDYNMPMLQFILDNDITLLDYEKISDDNNRRLVFFGEYAGNAGMIETLYGLGRRLKEERGIETPFLKVKHAYQYDSVEDAINHIRLIGKEIEKEGLPQEICPFNVFLMGYGHVSHGARQILTALPHADIEPEELAKNHSELTNNKIYISTFKEKHMVKPKDGSEFDLQSYYSHPQDYESRMEEFLDFCSVYVNAIYWSPESPVFVTNDYLKRSKKLIIIGDITCDINGSVAATIQPTWPDNPVFVYDPDTGKANLGFAGKGIAVMAVDNLPCEFSKEASDAFSAALMPFMEAMLSNDYSKPIAESTLPEVIKKACIVHQGKLQKDYEYLNQFLNNLKR